MEEALFRRSVQDDKSEGALFSKQLKLQMQKFTSSRNDKSERVLLWQAVKLQMPKSHSNMTGLGQL